MNEEEEQADEKIPHINFAKELMCVQRNKTKFPNRKNLLKYVRKKNEAGKIYIDIQKITLAETTLLFIRIFYL